jgi:hypothetical protein
MSAGNRRTDLSEGQSEPSAARSFDAVITPFFRRGRGIRQGHKRPLGLFEGQETHTMVKW